MASDYYNPSDNDKYVEDGDTCYADDLNKVNNSVNTGFEAVEVDVDAALILAVENAGISKEWAANDQADFPENPNFDPLDPNTDRFSAKAYALETKGWVMEDYPGEDPYNLANGDPFTERGAKVLAEECASDASDASDSADAAAASAAEAAGTNTFTAGDGIDVVKTGTDPYNYEVIHEDTSPLSAGSKGNTSGIQVFESVTIDDEGHVQAVATRNASFLPLSGGTITGPVDITASVLLANGIYHAASADGGQLLLSSSKASLGFVGGAAIELNTSSMVLSAINLTPVLTNISYLGTSTYEWKEVWANAYNGASDERVKKAIKPLEDTSWIYEVTPVSFKWKDEAAEDHTIFGFTAQDVDSKVTEALGNDERAIVIKPEDEEGIWGMSYNDLIAPMVKCIQDQKKLIDSLTERLEILEAN